MPKQKTTYKPFDLNIPRMGDSICVRSNGNFFSIGIEIKQRKAGFSPDSSRYTHVEISGGGHRSVRIMPPRAKAINITKVYAGRYIRIRRYKGEDWDRKRKHVSWIFATLCNSKYDKRGILGFLVGWIKHHASQWFCSEGLLYAHQTEYPMALKGLKPEDCMPAHVASSAEFETVWEGVLPKLIS